MIIVGLLSKLEVIIFEIALALTTSIYLYHIANLCSKNVQKRLKRAAQLSPFLCYNLPF